MAVGETSRGRRQMAAKVRFWRRPNRATKDEAVLDDPLTEIPNEVKAEEPALVSPKKRFLWRPRARRSKDDEPKVPDHTTDHAKARSIPAWPTSMRQVSPRGDSTSASPQQMNQNTSNGSDLQGSGKIERLFEVTCPLGINEGNTVWVRSPSGVQSFYAQVPKGIQYGDVFIVHTKQSRATEKHTSSTMFMPSDEAKETEEDSTLLLTSSGSMWESVCGGASHTPQDDALSYTNDHKNMSSSSLSSSSSSPQEKISYWERVTMTLDNWFTPIPEVLGRPVQ